MIVGQDNDRQLMLTIGGQPTCKLRPDQSRTFIIGEFQNFRVEFCLSPSGDTRRL